jgi:cell division protein FtsQ
MRFLKRDQDANPRRGLAGSRRGVVAFAGLLTLVALSIAALSPYGSRVALRASAAVERHIIAWTGYCGLVVANVQVEGRRRVSREAVLDALAAARGTPILAVDPAEAKRRLETIPWIRSASIERRLPDSLYVRLVERQPLAFWQRAGKLALVDREGVVVPAERLDGFGNLLVLVGSDAPLKGAALIDMLAREPDLAPHVAAAVRIGGRRWNLRLDSGIDVALPEEDAAGAWQRLAEVERRDGILERNIEMVDLRLPDRLVVRPVPDARKSPAKKGRQPAKAT